MNNITILFSEVMKAILTDNLRLDLFIVLIRTILVSKSLGQTIGKVVDQKTGNPFVGIHIILEGTPYGTVSKENGDFSLQKIPAGTTSMK